MTPRPRRPIALLSLCFLSVLSLGVPAGCSPAGRPDDSTELQGAPEVDSERANVSGTLPAGSTLEATTDVNLRSGPSSSYGVIHVVADGSAVTLLQSTPQNGYYKIKHGGTVGWSYGAYYQLKAAGTGGDTGGSAPSSGASSSSRDGAMARAKSGVGFSYWWGHGRWRAEGPTGSTRGTCSGSCPSCSHGGSYGADCSGYVAKAWQVPGSNSELSDDEHPYSTGDFIKNTSQWKTVSRDTLIKADALAYNNGTSGHIMLYSSGDGWGTVYAYECKGCSAGCVEGYRTVSSAYKGVRRSGF
jgi:uncharacterized protein YraI